MRTRKRFQVNKSAKICEAKYLQSVGVESYLEHDLDIEHFGENEFMPQTEQLNLIERGSKSDAWWMFTESLQIFINCAIPIFVIHLFQNQFQSIAMGEPK